METSLIRSKFASFAILISLLAPTGAFAETPLEEREFRDSSAPSLLKAPFLLPEYALRLAVLPLQKLVEWDEEYHLRERVVDIIANDDRTIWLYPTALFDSRDGFSIGGRYLHKNLLSQGDRLSLGGDVHENGDSDAHLKYRSKRYKYLNASLKYQDDSNSRFFGVGPLSSSPNKTVYEIRSLMTSLARDFKLGSPRFVLGLEVGFEKYSTSSGQSSRHPTVETVFSSPDLNGFEEDLEYFTSTASLAYDNRSDRVHPTSGRLIDFSYHQGQVTNGKDFDYQRIEINTTQLVEIEPTRRAIALGVHYATVSGNAPFYKLAVLDQNDAPLRGYQNGRFHDRKYLAGNLEYRYKIWETLASKNSFALGTLFLDAGQVYSRTSELSWGNTRVGGGLGVSFGVADFVLYRLQLAFGEGLNIIIGVNQAF